MQDPCMTIDTKVGKIEYKFWNVDKVHGLLFEGNKHQMMLLSDSSLDVGTYQKRHSAEFLSMSRCFRREVSALSFL